MPWGRGPRLRVLVAAMTTLVLTGCADDVPVPPTSTSGATSTPQPTSTPAGSTTPDRLRVAISFDQPGIGLKEGDSYSGLDVDVTRYVAQQMGVSSISFVRSVPDQRATLLETSQVDLVVASYSMTPERGAKVSFAGPYLVTGQDLLVRRSSRIRRPEQLQGFTVCAAKGSSSMRHLVDDYTGLHVVERPTVAECVGELRAGKVKAVTSDAAILAGYLRGDGEPELRLARRTFSTESYGIGVRRGDSAMCYRVSEALREMVRSGEWLTAVRANLPSRQVVGAKTYTVPQVRSCRTPDALDRRTSSPSGTSGSSTGTDSTTDAPSSSP